MSQHLTLNIKVVARHANAGSFNQQGELGTRIAHVISLQNDEDRMTRADQTIFSSLIRSNVLFTTGEMINTGL